MSALTKTDSVVFVWGQWNIGPEWFCICKYHSADQYSDHTKPYGTSPKGTVFLVKKISKRDSNDTARRPNINKTAGATQHKIPARADIRPYFSVHLKILGFFMSLGLKQSYCFSVFL